MSAACCAGVLPLRAAAPPLRLMLAKTLTRFAQHEALRVRIPSARRSKELRTEAITFFKVKMAEEEGFEPSYPGYRVNGFRDRRIQPLCHSSVGVKHGASQGRAMRRCWRRVRDLNPGDAFGAYTISNRAPSATRTTLRYSTGNCTVTRVLCKQRFSGNPTAPDLLHMSITCLQEAPFRLRAQRVRYA